MCEESDQRPDRVAAAEGFAEPHGCAGEQIQRVPEGGLLCRRADQQVPVDCHGLVHAPPVQPLRVRLPDGPQPSADCRLGPPEPGGDGPEPDAAGVRDQGDSIASVLSARRTATSVGSRIWVAEQSAQRARRGVTVTVSAPEAADDASATGPERAQHTLTTRAGHVPGQQNFLGPLQGRHDHHKRTSPFMPASIAYRTARREGPVRVAAGQLSLCSVTNLPTRSTVGNQPTTTGRPERPTWVARLVSTVVTPTNHRWGSLLSASPVTPAPRVMGIHGAFQQLNGAPHPPSGDFR